jgi:hypothetical protein
MTSARPFTARDRNLSSSGSRQALIGSVTSTHSAPASRRRTLPTKDGVILEVSRGRLRTARISASISAVLSRPPSVQPAQSHSGP